MTDSVKMAVESPGIQINRFAHRQLGWRRYLVLCVAVFAQLVTVLITWQLWEPRTNPPNLPVFELPQFPLSVFIVVSLIGVLIDPIRGFILHILLMITACLLDQYRMQPQFFATIVLMLAAFGRHGQLACYWFLAAMWFWAGLHKLLSPDWFAHSTYWILDRANFGRDGALYWHKTFALLVALSEIGLGVIALLRSRLAAYGCALLHLGIIAMLLTINWNFSVIPWNGATAIIGFWLLRSLTDRNKSTRVGFRQFPVFQTIVAIACFIPPAGFYFGVLDHGYANVLYSDLLPRAQITTKDQLQPISGWDVVNVPFPSERRLLRQYFELVARPGDKLHVRDPRPWLSDQYFILQSDGKAAAISADEFVFSSNDQLAGIGIDDRYCKFHLRQWGEVTQRYYQGNDSSPKNLISFAYTFKPEFYHPRRLYLLAGLPNLEELQLRGCAVDDDDLQIVSRLTRLRGIGLSNTGVTDEGLKYLANLPRLDIVETENTRISPAGLNWLQQQLRSFE